jgi:hypothetical protein
VCDLSEKMHENNFNSLEKIVLKKECLEKKLLEKKEFLEKKLVLKKYFLSLEMLGDGLGQGRALAMTEGGCSREKSGGQFWPLR